MYGFVVIDEAGAAAGEWTTQPWALKHAKGIVIVGSIATVAVAALAVLAGWRGWLATDQVTTVTDATGGLVSRTSQSDPGAARDGLLRLATACGVVTAGLLAWGRLELSRDEHRIARATDARAVVADERATTAEDRATAAYKLSEQAQVTDRYARAIEQLGHADVSVRLGALYALERLAHHAEPDDRNVIYEAICAWIRHQSVQRDEHGEPLQEIPEPQEPLLQVDGTATDYRAALDIALRPPRGWLLPKRDLTGAVLTYLDLTEGNVDDVTLSRAHLSQVTLGSVDEADFVHGTIRHVDFTGPVINANFDGAAITSATFGDMVRGASFWNGHLKQVWFGPKGRLTDVRFPHSTLADVSFQGALTGVDFLGATMTDVRIHARLQDVTWWQVEASDVDLRDIDADDLTIESSKLQGVDLTGASLRRATITSSGLFDVTSTPGVYDTATFRTVKLDDHAEPGVSFEQHNGKWYSRGEYERYLEDVRAEGEEPPT